MVGQADGSITRKVKSALGSILKECRSTSFVERDECYLPRLSILIPSKSRNIFEACVPDFLWLVFQNASRPLSYEVSDRMAVL